MLLQDYIFSLLTGYWDRPAGCEEREGLHYNPYFAGGYIAMAQALYNEAVEFDDGKCIYLAVKKNTCGMFCMCSVPLRKVIQ